MLRKKNIPIIRTRLPVQRTDIKSDKIHKVVTAVEKVAIFTITVIVIGACVVVVLDTHIRALVQATAQDFIYWLKAVVQQGA